jgi:hypothetical protein
VIGSASPNRTNGRFGPFREPKPQELCVRCGLFVPSIHTGAAICTKTGWCESCSRVPPNVSGALLRECLNLRRCDNKELREVIESWTDYFKPSGPKEAWQYERKKEEGKDLDMKE